MNTTPIEFIAWDNYTKSIITESVDCHASFLPNGSISTASMLGCELMQLTALRSINDEPIYNHMIVKDEFNYYYTVDMFDYFGMYDLSNRELEIVGNRFQHSELLELCK